MSARRTYAGLGEAVDPDDAVIAKGLLGIPEQAHMRLLDLEAAAVFLHVSPDGQVIFKTRLSRADAAAGLRRIADQIEDAS